MAASPLRRPNGNRIGDQVIGGAVKTYNTAAGTNNRLASDGTFTYLYDDEGNTERKTKISDGSYTQYAWDHRNRLLSITNKTALNVQTLKVTYDYDAFGQLVRRTEQGAAGGAVTAGNFVHDGGQIVMVLDGAGAVQHRLLWGAAVDQALADEALGTTYWYLTDHLGTVRDVVNNSGTVVNHLQYDAFGRRTDESNSALNDFDVGYTGKWLDRATGLQWNLHRWYDATTARWLSEDPIGFAAGDANLRRYVGNQGTSLTDPSGLVGGFFYHGPMPVDGPIRSRPIGPIEVGQSGWGIDEIISATAANSGAWSPPSKVEQIGSPHETEVCKGGGKTHHKTPQHGVDWYPDWMHRPDYIGSDGAGPCVICIITTPTGSFVAHFDGAGDATLPINRFMRSFSNGFGPTQAYVCGGDEDPISIVLLDDVLDALRGHDIPWKYFDTDGELYIDRNGNPVLLPR